MRKPSAREVKKSAYSVLFFVVAAIVVISLQYYLATLPWFMTHTLLVALAGILILVLVFKRAFMRTNGGGR